MPWISAPRRRLVHAFWPVAVLAALTSIRPTHAHSSKVHQDMTDMAFKIMQKVRDDPDSFLGNWEESSINYQEVYPYAFMSMVWELAPPSPSDFGDFLGEIQTAVPVIEGLDATGLRSPGSSCTALPASFGGFGSLAGATFALSATYGVDAGCGVRAGYGFGDYYASTSNLAAVTLGYMAAKPDGDHDDTHLFVRPVNMANGAVGTAVDVVDALADAAATALIAPFAALFCLADLIANTGVCPDPIDVADDVNPIDSIAESVSVGDFSGKDFVGVWHHVNVKSGQSDDYDDHQGFFLEEAGWEDELDAVETASMIAMDIAGMSVDYDDSEGIAKYELASVTDGLSPSTIRSKSQWQSRTFVHVPFSPLDNLAYYGWSRFRSMGPGMALDLSWPLHALGDAVSPMHTIGSPGWGHVPFEHWTEWAWADITYGSEVSAEHHTQVLRILRYAYLFRQRIVQWRAANPGHDKDIPIRDMVTTLAEDTLEYSSDVMFLRKEAYDDCVARCALGHAPDDCGPCTDRPWPFHPVASVFFHGDSTLDSLMELATYGLDPEERNAYTYDTESVDLVRPLLEMGMGAKIAFLTSAAEAK